MEEKGGRERDRERPRTDTSSEAMENVTVHTLRYGKAKRSTENYHFCIVFNIPTTRYYYNQGSISYISFQKSKFCFQSFNSIFFHLEGSVLQAILVQKGNAHILYPTDTICHDEHLPKANWILYR